MKWTPLNIAGGSLLRLMAAAYTINPRLRPYLRNRDGWINFVMGFRTRSGTVEQAIAFRDGRVSVMDRIPDETDCILNFVNDRTLMEMLRITPNEVLTLILHNKMTLDGNLAYLQLFNFYVSLLLGGMHERMLRRSQREDKRVRKAQQPVRIPEKTAELAGRKHQRLKGAKVDPGVRYLDDPYLSAYSLADFPRLQASLERHFTVMPEICTERPRLLTEWHRENGFETKADGTPWVPELRQALAFQHLMANRKPIIARDDIIAGTSTSKEPTGVIIYPDAQGTMIWGELLSVGSRTLNPYRISPEDVTILHDIFPFWTRRNFRETARRRFGAPLCLDIEQRWAFYFVWKSVGISHTVPDFPAILHKGTLGIMAEIDERLAAGTGGKDALTAMKICLAGVNTYARNLAGEARRQAAAETRPGRRIELENLARICGRVPARPAETLDEAVNALWILWVAVHMENTNTGLSLGRLDQWLQPFFERDMARLGTPEARKAYLKHAIELIGCFFMRGTDHLPLVPDLGNYLFGGSSSDQAITLGGVTPAGEDGVNDMTYIFLKVTEMLSIRDPNVNARFHPEFNSDAYLKRLCEVNVITVATPSLHGDPGVFSSLARHGYPLEDIRDWSSTGCVEPTLSGRHMGHTGSILMNLVAGMEMALNNGRHPGMDWDIGPRTGAVEDFRDFDAFFDAYGAQQKFLIDQAVTLNNMLAEIHAEIRPTPLLSAVMQGPLATGYDVTRGGALYNTSGSSNIGLADVTDSLMAIKKLVFDEKRITFRELKTAVDNNFADDPRIQALVRHKVPLFGSGDPEALAMANRVTRLIHDCYTGHTNYRGGRYTTGFWSMSQHVAYGNLSGALPSGRKAGQAFTPGLTPHPTAGKSFLDHIRDIARLDPRHMDNNIAFNVKIVPAAGETREALVDAMHAYVKTYFAQGGMQMQFNVVSSDILKDAMAHPENYRNLLVRISGYNAYFVTLNRQMQIELIERAEYGL
ncbi:MAG: pyruvate formate lyase family protein [Thermodesulfobacteriota bacterium]